MNSKKQRLDTTLATLYPQYSRRQLQDWISSGQITVDGNIILKNSYPVSENAHIIITATAPRYVSRAGYKLERALEYFAITVHNKVILDAGLSTGGFTDCLLQHGAQKIYGVDVGSDQAHATIRANPRVIVMEHTNLRELPDIGEQVNMVTLDLSFISVIKVIDTIKHVLKSPGELVILIKPQFELDRDAVKHNGIVKDAQKQQQAIANVTTALTAAGFDLKGVIDSPLLGGDGNKEFLAYFIKNN
jgi:23S rRNA (cytidine1920-2'-O)/16S rRNA (cytidine1409-2'-O)-methyltransferase